MTKRAWVARSDRKPVLAGLTRKATRAERMEASKKRQQTYAAANKETTR